jgi:hypothetical protein
MGRPMPRTDIASRSAPASRRLLPVLLAAFLLAGLQAAGCGDGGDGDGQAAPRTVQPAGVYRYATEGFERIGGPLPGRLAYPATTTITVDRVGCELSERWDAGPERWAQWRYCVTGGTWRLRGVTDHHEFFGRVERYSYRCSGRRVPRPGRIAEGFRWTDRCRAEGIGAVAEGVVVSLAPIAAAGSLQPAVHLRVKATLTGKVRGGYTMNTWLRRSDGLLLRRTMRSSTTVDSIVPDVPARERYSLRLRSTRPD